MDPKNSNKCFKNFENIHKGETIYIIGNGPSLSETDLNLIKDSPSIAMNRISLLYSKFKNWRPKYYIFCSSNILNPIWGKDWANSVMESLSSKETISFIDERCKEYLIKNNFKINKNIHIINKVTERKPNKLGEINKKSFSTNIIQSIDKSGSSINIALQLAYFMGASRIIFLGTDLGWVANIGKKKDSNHFDKSYRANISNPIKANLQMRNVHILAKNIFKKNKPNVEFYNASKFTKLDTYPIIKFESFVKEGLIIEEDDKLQEAKKYWINLKEGNKYLIRFRNFSYKYKEKFFKLKNIIKNKIKIFFKFTYF